MTKRNSLRGTVDGLTDGRLRGWVWDKDNEKDEIKIGIYARDELIIVANASEYRQDLRDAGIGNGYHAFALNLSAIHMLQLKNAGGEGIVRTIGDKQFLIGRFRIDPDEEKLSYSSFAKLTASFYKEIDKFTHLYDKISNSPYHVSRPHGHAYKKIMTAAAKSNTITSLPPSCPLPSKYVSYMILKQRKKKTNIDIDPTQIAEILDDYINSYSAARGSLRAPLSDEEIKFLNSEIILCGHKFQLTRVVWSEYLKLQHFERLPNLNDIQSFFEICYWWCIHQSKALGVEDCLAPRPLQAALKNVIAHGNSKIPLTAFMGRFAYEEERLKSLDLSTESNRLCLVILIMILSIDRPDFLRYVPLRAIRGVLETDENAESLFVRFLAEATGQFSPKITFDIYSRMIAEAGFHIIGGRFRSISPEGHRVSVSTLTRPNIPDEENLVDVQIIGPFGKASGIGQATRLSAQVLSMLDLSVNFVDFSLDNPAPTITDLDIKLSNYKRSRINILHLNADAIPMAFAYITDIFTGAYNIGYMYWELDRFSPVHELAIELLDEIWVSSAYGVETYRSLPNKTVANVGMCVEEGEIFEKSVARNFMMRWADVDTSDFIFLVSFDSFSYVQRKNPIGVLQAFLAAFPNCEKVKLIVKTQNRALISDPFQREIWHAVDRLIDSDDRIIMIDETFIHSDYLKFKQGADCYISLHRSEGWGFGMLEAMSLKVPVVCTNYSANKDFCTSTTAWLVECKEVLLDTNDYIYVTPGHKWAEPDLASAMQQLRNVLNDAPEREKKIDNAYNYVHEKFSRKAISERYGSRLNELMRLMESE